MVTLPGQEHRNGSHAMGLIYQGSWNVYSWLQHQSHQLMIILECMSISTFDFPTNWQITIEIFLHDLKLIDIIITRNERKVGCPIICTDTICNAILFIRHTDNPWNNNAHSSITTPCFTLTSNIVRQICIWVSEGSFAAQKKLFVQPNSAQTDSSQIMCNFSLRLTIWEFSQGLMRCWASIWWKLTFKACRFNLLIKAQWHFARGLYRNWAWLTRL